MSINWQQYIPTLTDIVERGAKTFAGGFIVGAGLLSAAVSTLTGAVDVAASQINWAHGLDFGIGTTVVSAIFSLASLKISNPGTASLSRFIELVRGVARTSD